jgi:thiamine biosynthesis lipoprotein ApbE/Na+-translocating ferredoxin:NAD+ oxidoreductase RnfG subunit
MRTQFSYSNDNGYLRDKRLLRARMLPRLFRLAVLAAVAALVYSASLRPQPPDAVSLADARTFFPDAARLAGGDRRLGGQTVVDTQGLPLGLVLTTSPHTDEVIGYAGPSNLLIALDPQQRLIGVRLLTSGDTQAHVEQVRQSDPFWKQFAGWRRDTRPPRVEGVSGSTLTSLAMAEAIGRRLGGPVTSLRFPEPVTLAEAQQLFPSAATLKANEPRPGWHRVLGDKSTLLGFAVRTSPYTDNGRGYRGPTESLVGIAADARTVTGVVLRRSYDTPEYVERVKDDDEFFRTLTGRTIDELAAIDFARAGIEGVSGATQTSFAVADGLKRRFAADRSAARAAARSVAWNPGLLAVICGGLALTFTRLRTSRRLRTIWQVILIIVFLFWLGDLLSLALLAGWARHGVPWATAPSVILFAAVAFVVPWATRRQIYCQHICPHGAAQTLLGRFKHLHIRLPASAQRWLTRLRFAILLIGVAIAIFWLNFDLAWLEPFDGWVLKVGALSSASIAVVGLIASVFVPQAYCRYGCPTGELLHIVKSGGRHDKITRRDWTASVLVLLATLAIFSPRLFTARRDAPRETTKMIASEFSGRAFGTTWSVKIRGKHETTALKTAVATELEHVESSLSHWRPDSFTSQFNSSETTLAAEYPAELIALVARAQELSRLTSGRYDITVAPLVDAWGFGPSGEKARAPSDEEIRDLLAHTGYQKLAVDADAKTLRKSHPQLQIDLGSLLQGYAADCAATILDDAGVTEFLVEVGGELFARGSWQVAIEDPRDPHRPLRTLTLTDCGLATSGFYRATKLVDGNPIHHLISPQTGRPVAATAAISAVIASSAVDADAWATALLTIGLPEGLALADQQRLAALLLDVNHQPRLSARGASLFGGE